MKCHDYFSAVMGQLQVQFEEEHDNIIAAAQLMSETIQKDGLIHVFGSGHSQMFGLEMFYRSGGLVPINALLYPQMAVVPHALLSSAFERLEGWADEALALEPVTSHDVFIIASVSGRNGSIVDMALAAKKRGCKIIALTSLAYSTSVTSRHSSGFKLMDLADIIIDLKCPHGDATCAIEGLDVRFAPSSSVLGLSVVNALVAQTVENCVHLGVEPPIWVSANVDSATGAAINRNHVKRYAPRIRFL